MYEIKCISIKKQLVWVHDKFPPDHLFHTVWLYLELLEKSVLDENLGYLLLKSTMVNRKNLQNLCFIIMTNIRKNKRCPKC